MKAFKHFNAYSVAEAVSLLGRYEGKARLIAGGTDLLGKMKDRVLPEYPEALVNLKTIAGLSEVREDEGEVRLGALLRLHDVAIHPLLAAGYSALAQAAGRTASPQIRHMGTIAGNLCQDVRCWYYRTPRNRFSCLRKGGGRCYALLGDHRFHSIFGGSVAGGCIAVHPSDTAPALIALGAEIVTSKRTIPLEDFFQVGVNRTTVLEKDEIVTEIKVPKPPPNTKSLFLKFALRKSIDFPLVNCAVMITRENNVVSRARICLNAVWVVPRRVRAAEDVIMGKTIDERTADAAAAAAVADAKPLAGNAYLVQIARSLVKRALLAGTE